MSPSTSLNLNDNVGRTGALIVVFKLRDDGSVLLQFSEPHYPIRDTRYYILELPWFRKISENYLGQGWTTAKAICELEPPVKRQLAILDLIRVHLLKNENFQKQLKYDVEDRSGRYHMSTGGAYSARTWPSGGLGWSDSDAIEQRRMREVLKKVCKKPHWKPDLDSIYMGSVSDDGLASTYQSSLFRNTERSSTSDTQTHKRQRLETESAKATDLSGYHLIVSEKGGLESWNSDLTEEMQGPAR
jgi:hypothetical protein